MDVKNIKQKLIYGGFILIEYLFCFPQWRDMAFLLWHELNHENMGKINGDGSDEYDGVDDA